MVSQYLLQWLARLEFDVRMNSSQECLIGDESTVEALYWLDGDYSVETWARVALCVVPARVLEDNHPTCAYIFAS
jgi:hypothetical protein